MKTEYGKRRMHMFLMLHNRVYLINLLGRPLRSAGITVVVYLQPSPQGKTSNLD